jgi:hypothetical protein
MSQLSPSLDAPATNRATSNFGRRVRDEALQLLVSTHPDRASDRLDIV